MKEFENQFTTITSLIGDKARSVMLWHLLDGRAYTATELAICADISAQSASNHLTKMINANLLSVEKQGRHRYYRYANAEVARVVESIACLVPPANKKIVVAEPGDFVHARTCYDHLAGKLGVGITEALLQQKIISTHGRDFELTKKGEAWFIDMGIDVCHLRQQRRPVLRPCLDWSERKNHLAGSLAAALLNKMLTEDWIRRIKNSRTVCITAKGEKKLHQELRLML